MRRAATLRWVFPVLLATTFSPLAASADYSFQNLNANASTLLVVPGDGIIALYLSRTPTGSVAVTQEAIEITPLPFQDTSGANLPVTILLPGEPLTETAKQSETRKLTVNSAVTQIRLQVGSIGSPRRYSGSLVLGKDGAFIKSYLLTIGRPRTEREAKVLLDQRLVLLTKEECAPGNSLSWPGWLKPFFQCEPYRFTKTLRDESGDWQVEVLSASVEALEGSNSAFDPIKQLQFKVNGKPANLWSFDPNTLNPEERETRTLRAGGRSTIEGELQPLPAGSYTATIRLSGANSQPDTGQLLMLTVKVRKPVWWAVLFLLAGIAISLVVTVVLKSRADLLRLKRKILDITPLWLNDEPPTQQVSWVKSIFDQAGAFPAFFSPAVVEILGERVDLAAKQLPFLRRIGQIRRRIDRRGWSPMVRRRAQKILQSVADRLEPGEIDPAAAESVKAGLDALDKWFTPEYAQLYWEDLSKDIKGLLLRVNLDIFAAKPRATAGKLAERLKQPDPTDLQSMVARENDYAALKLLIERYKDETLVNTLSDLCEKKRPMEELFDEADQAAWQQLKNRIRFASPKRRSTEPFEPFQPLLFELATEPPEFGDNYLFKHNLRYQWRFKLACRKRFSAVPIEMKVETPEPRVYQYAPRKCPSITASVSVRWKLESFEAKTGETDCRAFSVPIEKSSLNRLFQSIQTNELFSLGLAVVVGVGSGLLVQYYGNETFGSAKDMLGVFLWGAGANQASNSFVDVIGRFQHPQPAGAASSASASGAPAQPAAQPAPAAGGAAVPPAPGSPPQFPALPVAPPVAPPAVSPQVLTGPPTPPPV